MKILFIQGPNINLLSNREQDKYGTLTMDEIHSKIKKLADKNDIDTMFFQSNIEGEIVNRIQESMNESIDYIVINAAAYTHSSIAIRDAILASNIKTIEVHLSNIFERETFRHHSYISDVAVGIIAGFREESYLMALGYIINKKGQ